MRQQVLVLLPGPLRVWRRRTSPPCRTGAPGRCRGCPCRRCPPRDGSRWRTRRSASADRAASRISSVCSPASGISAVPTRYRSSAVDRPSRVGHPHRIHLLAGAGEEAGAEQRLLAHQHRRHHRGEPVRHQPVQRPLHQGELEHHRLALQVGEAGPGDLGAALDVDDARAPRRDRGDPAPRSRTPWRLAPGLDLDVVLVGRPPGTEAWAGLGSGIQIASNRRRARRPRPAPSCTARPGPPPRRSPPASRRPAAGRSPCRTGSARPADPRPPPGPGAAPRPAPPEPPRPRSTRDAANEAAKTPPGRSGDRATSITGGGIGVVLAVPAGHADTPAARARSLPTRCAAVD